MAIVTATRLLRFNAAHRVHNPALSDVENTRLFGKCNNPNWHGHNYTLEVSVKGPIDERTGYVMVLSALDNLAKGASGGAVQAANVALGLNELDGLSMVGMYP